MAAIPRRIADVDVFPIGLGAMPMSTEPLPSEAQAIRTIHAAVDAGATLIDTADAYAPDEATTGHNEELIAKALADGGRRDRVIVATKGGHVRRGKDWALDGRPEHLKRACEDSLRRLRTDRIDLYQFHRPDPAVPIAESVGALSDLRDEGKIRWAGVSNFDADQIAEAAGIVDLTVVQNELSPAFTSSLTKGEVDLCTRRGIAFLPWSPLGGIGKAGTVPGGSQPIREAAERHEVSPQRVVLAWLLALGPTVIPIPGASRPETITDSLAAAELELEPEEVEAITAALS